MAHQFASNSLQYLISNLTQSQNILVSVGTSNNKSPRKKKIKEKPSRIFTVHCPVEENNKYFVGSFLLGKTNNLVKSEWEQCKAFISSKSDTDYLIITQDEITASIELLIDTPLIQDIISTNVFSISFKQEEIDLYILLYFTTLPIEDFTKRISIMLKEVFSIVFNVTTISEEDEITLGQEENLTEVYRKIRELQLTQEIPKLSVQSSFLKVQLRPYQEEAVRWILHREKSVAQSEEIHPCYCPIQLESGIIIYFNKYTGHVTLEKPLVHELKTGGILADEMGLGKTVEILACILYEKSLNSQESTGVNNDEANIPAIHRRSKKRKINEVRSNTASNKPCDSSSDPDCISAKKSKRGVGCRAALQSWYDSALRSVNERPTFKKVQPVIQCICGDQYDKHIVVCKFCQKKQHATCMGYESDLDNYLCPQCWKNEPSLQSNGTLIVCPKSLKEQWSKEIIKHINGGLHVFHYQGAQAMAIYPTTLQKYDIVITTYNVLQADFRQAECVQEKTLRTQSRYSSPGCPILLIKWKRICLDEAQLIENPGQMVSEMALKLNACHRWAITGTPISKGLSDLYGLIDYLQFEPYNEMVAWNNLLYKPYKQGNWDVMLNFLTKILWRTQKCDVIDQINIPNQSVLEYFLELNAIERYLYNREHELSCAEFVKKIKDYDATLPIVLLQKGDLKKLMLPFLSLRQVCATPNTVKGRFLAMKKDANSMEELLNALIAKNITECEDYLRSIIACLNGSAGILILLQNVPEAIKIYKKILKLEEDFNNNPSTKLLLDALQLIHAKYNLFQLLNDYPSLVDENLQDRNLQSEYLDLEKKYTEKLRHQIISADSTLCKYLNESYDLSKQIKLEEGRWYITLLDYVVENDFYDELIAKVSMVIVSNNYENYYTMPNIRRLMATIKTWDDEIELLREEVIDSVGELYNLEEGNVIIDQKLVEPALDCHIAIPKPKYNCPLCLTDKRLKKYETKLFFAKEKGEETTNWKPSKEEQIIRAMLVLGRNKSFDKDILKDGNIFCSLIDLYKKEFKEIRKKLTNIFQLVSAMDEIDLCKKRMTLKIATEGEGEKMTPQNREIKNLSDEVKNPFANIDQIKEHELDYYLTKFEAEGKTSSMYLDRALGTNKYLQTLHIQQDSGQQPDPCPICKNNLENNWNALKCGHCYCIPCMQVLLSRTPGKYISCCVCREKQDIKDISYLEESGKTKENISDVNIKGNFSTKIESVLKLLIKLRQVESDIKVIVFSNWVSVLKVLKTVLDLNDVSSEIVDSSSLEKKLENFKSPSKNITALLMPIQLGSKGLNIIEATHIVFIEPLLNPADEQQAIGRIHRIGQTRPTVVHKLIIKDTIEETIHFATSSNAKDWDRNKVTLNQIKNLFLSNAFDPTESENIGE